MVYTWIWGGLASLFLISATIRAWSDRNGSCLPSFLLTALATLAVFAGIGLQCINGISMIGSIRVLPLPIAFGLLMLTQIMNIKLKTPLLTALTNPLALLLIISSIRLTEDVPQMRELPTTLIAHIFMIFMCFALIFIANLMSIILLVQDRRLKRQLDFKSRLPSLDLLERIVRTLNITGFICLTLGITLGLIHGGSLAAATNMPVMFSLLTWLSLLILVVLHSLRIVGGPRLAMGNLLIFILMLITLLGGHGT